MLPASELPLSREMIDIRPGHVRTTLVLAPPSGVGPRRALRATI